MSTRAFRRLICRVLIAAVVFAQMAVAAYGCSRLPGTATAVQLHAATIADAGIQPASDSQSRMTHHEGMAPMMPNLCAGHCQFGNQSADHTAAPAVSPGLLNSWYTIEPLHRASELDHMRGVVPTQGSPPGADPPHAILHCCLRD
jgi:hypothetical protein